MCTTWLSARCLSPTASLALPTVSSMCGGPAGRVGVISPPKSRSPTVSVMPLKSCLSMYFFSGKPKIEIQIVFIHVRFICICGGQQELWGYVLEFPENTKMARGEF
ncbi:hypothetical protein BKA93DRAFT_752457 [Sparassis latifolia]